MRLEPADRRRIKRRRDDEDDDGWRPADGWWRSDRAGEILRAQPLQKIIDSGFEQLLIAHCEAMLGWTIERKAPAWATHSRDVDRSDVHEWTSRFAEMLGILLGLIDREQAEVAFLDPICKLSDEDTCFDLLSPLVTMFLCQHVLDVPIVAPIMPTVLDRALDRLLAAPAFRPDRYRSGELYGFSMPSLARWLMFVGVKEAALACRYSNGDWTDIGLILPTIDRFVQHAGWVPSVMSDFLTLVERAHEYFPAEAFADAILAAMTATADSGTRWRGTQISARIASRVQDMSDSAAPLQLALGQKFLRILDMLVDQGDRRSAALQIGPAFRDLRLSPSNQ